jgi:hypothetical protein
MASGIKLKALTFLFMAVILTALIAAALPQLELKPGISLPAPNGNGESLPQEQVPAVSISINTYLKTILGILLVVFLTYAGYKLIKGVPWKSILAPALFIAALVMAWFYFLFILAGGHIQSDPYTTEILPSDLNLPGPPIGPLPLWLTWLVWIGLAVGTALLGIWLIRRQPKYTQTRDPLELEAEKALQALRTGSHLNNVIVRCYIQMSQVLQKDQEIELEQSMTARDFECLLEARGIPYGPVHQLTQLFETARYGYRQPGPADEQKAFECLNAIIQFSRTKRKPN